MVWRHSSNYRNPRSDVLLLVIEISSCPFGPMLCIILISFLCTKCIIIFELPQGGMWKRTLKWVINWWNEEASIGRVHEFCMPTPFIDGSWQWECHFKCLWNTYPWFESNKKNIASCTIDNYKNPCAYQKHQI